MFGKIWASAKAGGLGYFLGGVLIVSISLLVPFWLAKLDNWLLNSIAWVISTAISVLLVVPFITWFNIFTKKLGWVFVTITSWKDVLNVAYWSVSGSLLGGLFWYIVYLNL